MKRPNPPSRDEWMDERVEAYVDGDLRPDELDTFTSILDDAPYWQTQVRRARQVQEGLHEISTQPCPPDVTSSILEHVRHARSQPAMPWWKQMLQEMMHTWRALVAAQRRPVVDYAVGLALVGIAVFFIINPLEDPANSDVATSVSSTFSTAPITAPYSDAEIRRATVRAYEALNQFSLAGQQASETVQTRMRDAASPAASARPSTTSEASSETSPAPSRILDVTAQLQNQEQTADARMDPSADDADPTRADSPQTVSASSSTPH